ncbi:MAG: Lon-like protease, partial [Actinomycetota bacterium]
FVLRLPYYTSRGGVRSATNAVHIDGVDPPAGRILFPIVQIEQDTVIALLGDWGDDDADIRSSDQLLQGADVHELARANLRLMVESKRTAADVAAAVSGARFAPDVVRIDTGPIGGPSGGLAFALAILDMLSGGRLSAGRTICATGALARDGAVSVVGGITLKTGAAERAGCVFLLVPSANYDEASAASDEMPVVPIASLADAIAAVTSTSGTVDDATELRCHAQGLGSVIYPSRECARAT